MVVARGDVRCDAPNRYAHKLTLLRGRLEACHALTSMLLTMEQYTSRRFMTSSDAGVIQLACNEFVRYYVRVQHLGHRALRVLVRAVRNEDNHLVVVVHKLFTLQQTIELGK